jgi:hypothetical protein
MKVYLLIACLTGAASQDAPAQQILRFDDSLQLEAKSDTTEAYDLRRTLISGWRQQRILMEMG